MGRSILKRVARVLLNFFAGVVCSSAVFSPVIATLSTAMVPPVIFVGILSSCVSLMLLDTFQFDNLKLDEDSREGGFGFGVIAVIWLVGLAVMTGIADDQGAGPDGNAAVMMFLVGALLSASEALTHSFLAYVFVGGIAIIHGRGSRHTGGFPFAQFIDRPLFLIVLAASGFVGVALGRVLGRSLTELRSLLAHIIASLKWVLVAYVAGYGVIAALFAVNYWGINRLSAGACINFSNSATRVFESVYVRGLDYIYFSTVTIATLGYGDVTPTCPPAKILAGGEVLLGVAWTTVVLAAAVSRLPDFVESRKPSKRDSRALWS